MWVLTTYYPQGNGQDESTNKVFKTLLAKLVSENKTDWNEHLFTMLFSTKVTTRYTPYKLMYGLHPIMPIEYIIPIVSGNEKDSTPVKVLISIITKLE